MDDGSIDSDSDIGFGRVRVGAVAYSGVLSRLTERGIAVLPVTNARDGLRAIIQNKIDAFVHNEAILKYLAKKEFPARIHILADIFNEYYVSMGMPTGSPLRETINRALLHVLATDEWRKLRERYLGTVNE